MQVTLQAFVDTWVWDEQADRGFVEILVNEQGRFTPQTTDLIAGLEKVLKRGSLLAYLVSMTLRVVEIRRVLKPTGSFYLHCDPTASHYLKLVLDTVFVTNRGEFRNEIIWCYRKWSVTQRQFVSNHDVIFFYSKTQNNIWNQQFSSLSAGTMKRWKGKKQQAVFENNVRKATSEQEESSGSPMADWWEVSIINPNAAERLGYPTQKPEALLERIIQASTNPGDTVLDAYCGCGTTIAVAENLKRQWVGIDITYQSISLILRRLEAQFGKEAVDAITLNGIPQDMKSAQALALKKDDRVRKEFEKWAVLTYSSNRAIINDTKGADKGIDGIAYFMAGANENAKIVFQVKSGNVGRGDVAKLNSDRLREGAELAVFLTLQPPTKPMLEEAKGVGSYEHKLMGRSYPRLQIVTVAEMVEQHRRLEIPMGLEVLKRAQAAETGTAHPELFDAGEA